jgi:hypothetical protein
VCNSLSLSLSLSLSRSLASTLSAPRLRALTAACACTLAPAHTRGGRTPMHRQTLHTTAYSSSQCLASSCE